MKKYTITNISREPVSILLNSGESRHLAPRATSQPLLEVEVTNNRDITKLQDRRLIAVHELASERPPARPSKKRPPESISETGKTEPGE